MNISNRPYTDQDQDAVIELREKDLSRGPGAYQPCPRSWAWLGSAFLDLGYQYGGAGLIRLNISKLKIA